MIDKRGRGSRRSEIPEGSVAGELKQKRDEFLHTFFKRGAELTEELVGDNRKLRSQLLRLEEENTSLRTQLASDKAIRDLLNKIDDLEREKERLLSAVHEQAEISSRVTEIESELESFANLYVASFQLHSSLRVRTVVRNVKELLVQLVGVRSLGIYFVDDSERYLVAIASDGVDLGTLQKIQLRNESADDALEAIVERTYLTGVPHVAEGEVVSMPAACIPLQLEDRVVGVIVVYSLLEHKRRFVTVDRELFKLLGAHAGGAIVSAHLYGHSNALPGAAVLRETCA
jgi:GAF domain-containing protein